MKIIAHRGVTSLAPENTMASFRKAKELGAKAIELDVHYSKDKKLVIHHNYAFGDPDNGVGLIVETDSTNIKHIDAGSWFSQEYVGEHIPYLEEVFEEFSKDFEYEIELKGTSLDFLENILHVIHKYGVTGNIECTSPHLALLCKLKYYSPKMRCGVFFSEYPKWILPHLGEQIIIDTLKLVPAEVAHIPNAIVTKSLVDTLHYAGKLVHVADCNTKNEMDKAITYGCDQFSTDNILLARKIVSI